MLITLGGLPAVIILAIMGLVTGQFHAWVACQQRAFPITGRSWAFLIFPIDQITDNFILEMIPLRLNSG